jgi:four helix bundle protein
MRPSEGVQEELERFRAARAVLVSENMASVDRFEDLVAWQLSEQLREAVFEFTARDGVKRDFDFCDDIRRSARSAPANIAEGFGYYTPTQNARYVTIARASLQETLNHVLDAAQRGYINGDERNAILRLNKRALGATGSYLSYLKSCKQAPPGWSRTRNKDQEDNQEPENPT